MRKEIQKDKKARSEVGSTFNKKGLCAVKRKDKSEN